MKDRPEDKKMPMVLTLSLEQSNLLISKESYSHEMENGGVQLLN